MPRVADRSPRAGVGGLASNRNANKPALHTRSQRPARLYALRSYTPVATGGFVGLLASSSAAPSALKP